MAAPKKNPFLEAALEYASHGMKVRPLRPNEKAAIHKGGLSNATDDPDVIRHWWAETPKANIGIACGLSDLVVIDLDEKNGKHGRAEWDRLAADHGFESNGVLSATTPTGGVHLYYRMPPQRLKTKTGILGEGSGIDVLGDNGQVVAPPSVIDGKPYQWTPGDHVPGELPQCVVDLLSRPADPWKVQTLADAFQPRPPKTELIRGVIPTEALVIVYAAPGALKSMNLADAAVCVAAGKPWLEPLPGHSVSAFDVPQAVPVLWLDVDNGSRRTADRFEALARAHAVPTSTPLHYVSMPNPPFIATDPQARESMAKRIIANGYRLVIIDNLAAIKGAADENSDAMAHVMAALRELVEQTGTTIIVIHHQRKSQMRAPDSQGGRDGETLRGHSSIEAAIDLALLVMREPGSPNVLIKSTKDRDAGVEPFAAAFTYEHDASGRLYTARMCGVQAIGKAEAKAAETTTRVLQTLGAATEPLGVNDLHEILGGRKADLSHTLAQMHLAGQLTRTEGPRRAKLYAIREATS